MCTDIILYLRKDNYFYRDEQLDSARITTLLEAHAEVERGRWIYNKSSIATICTM